MSSVFNYESPGNRLTVPAFMALPLATEIKIKNRTKSKR